jgi:hypothetical protein
MRASVLVCRTGQIRHRGRRIRAGAPRICGPPPATSGNDEAAASAERGGVGGGTGSWGSHAIAFLAGRCRFFPGPLLWRRRGGGHRQGGGGGGGGREVRLSRLRWETTWGFFLPPALPLRLTDMGRECRYLEVVARGWRIEGISSESRIHLDEEGLVGILLSPGAGSQGSAHQSKRTC